MKTKSEGERKIIVAKIEQSDLSVVRACKANGLSDATYYKWRAAIKKNMKNKKTVALNMKPAKRIAVEPLPQSDKLICVVGSPESIRDFIASL